MLRLLTCLAVLGLEPFCAADISKVHYMDALVRLTHQFTVLMQLHLRYVHWRTQSVTQLLAR